MTAPTVSKEVYPQSTLEINTPVCQFCETFGTFWDFELYIYILNYKTKQSLSPSLHSCSCWVMIPEKPDLWIWTGVLDLLKPVAKLAWWGWNTSAKTNRGQLDHREYCNGAISCNREIRGCISSNPRLENWMGVGILPSRSKPCQKS